LRNLLNAFNRNILIKVDWSVNIDGVILVSSERLRVVNGDRDLARLNLLNRDILVCGKLLRDGDTDLTRNGNRNLARNGNWDLSGDRDITTDHLLTLGLDE
jgi:hypothetical protein